MVVHRRALHKHTREKLPAGYDSEVYAAESGDVRAVLAKTNQGYNCVLACGRFEELPLTDDHKLVKAFEEEQSRSSDLHTFAMDEWLHCL